MFSQGNFRVNFNCADFSNLSFPAKDREVLRKLAGQVADIASRPIMAENRTLWYQHNALQTTRPLILCDPENGWNEIITDDQILCENSIARHWECHFRKQIYWGDHIKDDYVVEPVFDLPFVSSETPWGIAGSAVQATDKRIAETGQAYHIDPILTDYNLIDKITRPVITVDREKTQVLLDQAKEIFGDLLKVRVSSVWYWSIGLTDEFAFLRGMENLLYDFYDEPEAVHTVMGILTDGIMAKLDYLEQENLFCLNNDHTYVGSGGIGYTTELPAADFQGGVRTKDLWLLSESQITIGVSPAMFAEFIFPYQKKFMDRFGLTCYGCCEPMDDRFDIVKAAKNLRRVSVSAWANKALMAEKLGRDYVYSMKPNPSPLAMPEMNVEAARSELREGLRVSRNNHVEIIMKDNHTLGKNPANLINWVKMAREEIARL